MSRKYLKDHSEVSALLVAVDGLLDYVMNEGLRNIVPGSDHRNKILCCVRDVLKAHSALLETSYEVPATDKCSMSMNVTITNLDEFESITEHLTKTVLAANKANHEALYKP